MWRAQLDGAAIDEQDLPCSLCSRPVLEGHWIYPYRDFVWAHCDCENPANEVLDEDAAKEAAAMAKDTTQQETKYVTKAQFDKLAEYVKKLVAFANELEKGVNSCVMVTAYEDSKLEARIAALDAKYEERITNLEKQVADVNLKDIVRKFNREKAEAAGK